MLSLLEFVFVLAELTEVPLAMGAAEGMMCMEREAKIRRRGRVLSDGNVSESSLMVEEVQDDGHAYFVVF